MKTLLIVLATVGVAAGAMAQGKVNIVNDSSHLLQYSANPADLKPGDAALAGTSVSSPSNPNNTWMMSLYGNVIPGSAEGLLSLLANPSAVTSFAAGSPAAGRFNAISMDLPSGYAGGTAVDVQLHSFQIRLWQKTAANYTSYADALAGGAYTAKTPVFNMNPGLSAPNSMASSLSPSFSTWAAGPIVAVVPEPATASLVGLGLASLLIFRRRK